MLRACRVGKLSGGGNSQRAAEGGRQKRGYWAELNGIVSFLEVAKRTNGSEDRGLKVRFSLATIAFDRESAQMSQILSSQGKNAPSSPYPHYLVRLATSRNLNGRKGSKLLPAISCDFLRFPAVFCSFLRLQTTYRADQGPNLQKSAKIFDKLPFLPFSLSHLALRSQPPFTGVLLGPGPESAPRSAFWAILGTCLGVPQRVLFEV